MKGKIKKFFLFVAGAIFSLSLGVACVSCNNSVESITLENFGNIEIAADLDASYMLPIGNVTDTNGNDYRVTFEVTTKSGKTINPFNNAFQLKYFEDYYVLCTADLGNGQTQTRTITIKVQDTGKPVITFGMVKRGIVGKAYTLPETMVEDSSKESLTASLKVFELNDNEKGKEMPLADGTFIPERIGYYLIEATATDSNGNTGVEQTTVYVREAPEVNELVSFKYAEDIECVGWSQKNGSITWLEEFEGETGVAKFSYTGTYWANAFSVLPLQDVSSASSLYEDYDTLIVRMYIKNDAEYTNYFAVNGSTQMVINKNVAGSDKEVEKAYHTKTNIAYNQWVDFTFDINAISAWDNEVLDVYSDKLWGYGVKLLDADGTTEIAHKGEFYVAGIFCAKKVEVSATASSYAVGNTVTFSTNATDSNTVYTLMKPDGTAQTLTGNTYTIAQEGVHTVKVVGSDYYGESRFTATRALVNEQEFLSFNYADDIKNVAANTTRGSFEILSSYENETGVLKFNWNGNKWPTLSLAPLQDKAAYEQYSYVVFRVWISDETPIANIKMQGGYKEDGSAHNYDTVTAIAYNRWVDYKFSISALANWADGVTANELLRSGCTLFCTYGTDSEGNAITQGTIYIADVSFV